MKFILRDSNGRTLTETLDQLWRISPTKFDVPESLVARNSQWGSKNQSDNVISTRKLSLPYSKTFQSDLEYNLFRSKLANFFLTGKKPIYLIDVENGRRASIEISSLPEKFDKGSEKRIVTEANIELILMDVLFEDFEESDTDFLYLASGGYFDIYLSSEYSMDGYPIFELIAESNSNPDFSLDLEDEEGNGFATQRIQCLSFSNANELNKYMTISSVNGEVMIGGRPNTSKPITYSNNNLLWTGGSFLIFRPGKNRVIYSSAVNAPVSLRIRHRTRYES
ncbi:phage tail protein [Leptospira sp. 201903071]|uniref:phage tail protein n=1 Tax=Leptospira ainazelensis TaxID=2810034 RepID=UPI001962741B|nr:phage tail protein [Leptospira ainazelensis]MBM9502877.1 phage tail protein [Leptospira ainazelensis]